MMLRGHNSITATGRATHLKVEWRHCRPVSSGLNTRPNTPSSLCMQLNGFNGIGNAKSAEQQADYSQSVR